MGKIFEVDFRNRSMMDNVSGVVPSILGTSRFVRTPQGYALRFNGDGHLNYGVMPWAASNSDHHTFVFVLKNRGVRGAEFYKAVFGAYPPTLTEGAIDIGAGITNTPQSVRMYFRGVNNVPNKEVFTAVPVMDEDFRLVIIERNGDTAKLYADNILRDTEVGLAGIDTSTSSKPVLLGGRQLWVGDSYKGDLLFFKVYDHVFSPLERVDEYQLFRHSSPTSTANIIHHRIPVDPTGSVLCHDYSRWNGGIVPDLSGNGNDGTPVGFVDVSNDGARFPGINGNYIDCGNGGGITGNLTIEALVKKKDVVGQEGIINKGTSTLTAINYYLGFNADELRYIISDGVVVQDIVTTTLNALANEWYYTVLTIDGSFLTSYANGREILQTAQTVIPTSNANALLVGALHPVLFLFDGSMKLVKVSPYALTETQIKNRWNSIARLVIFNEPMFNQLPDNRSYTAGMYLENWQVASGTFTVKEDSTGTYIECSGDGVIQYKGVDLSMYHENGFIKRIVGDISSDQGDTVDNATYVAWASNVLSVTLTAGQKLYELVIQIGEEQ